MNKNIDLKTVIRDYMQERFYKYGEDFDYVEDEKFSKMTIRELRSYVTMFCFLVYNDKTVISFYEKISGKKYEYNKIKVENIKYRLNKEFNRRYNNDFVTLYDFARCKIIKKSTRYWQEKDDMRYSIFSYYPKHTKAVVFNAFILAYQFYQYCKRNMIPVKAISDIYHLMESNPSYSYFYDSQRKKMKEKRDNQITQIINNPNNYVLMEEMMWF